jgi:hypothetical protein
LNIPLGGKISNAIIVSNSEPKVKMKCLIALLSEIASCKSLSKSASTDSDDEHSVESQNSLVWAAISSGTFFGQ